MSVKLKVRSEEANENKGELCKLSCTASVLKNLGPQLDFFVFHLSHFFSPNMGEV